MVERCLSVAADIINFSLDKNEPSWSLSVGGMSGSFDANNKETEMALSFEVDELLKRFVQQSRFSVVTDEVGTGAGEPGGNMNTNANMNSNMNRNMNR